MGVSHDEKCKKYKRKIEDLKLDLIDLQEKYDELEINHQKLKKKND